MNEITATGEPATELEQLIAEPSESESLTVQFLGPGGDTMLYCYVHELCDGQRMRPEKLAAWRALRDRFGNRDESRVDRGALLAPAA